MRQLNFDLKTLQARHRDGAFVTRRDRAYALAQKPNRGFRDSQDSSRSPLTS